MKIINMKEPESEVKKLTLFSIIRLMWRSFIISFRAMSKIGFILSLIVIFLPSLSVFSGLISATFFDRVQMIYQGDNSMLVPAFYSLAAFLIFEVFANGVYTIENIMNRNNWYSIYYYLNKRLLEICTMISFRYIDNNTDFRKKMTVIKDNAINTITNSSFNAFGIVGQLLASFSSVSIMLGLDPWLTLLLVVTIIPSAYLAGKQSEGLYSMTTWSSKERDFQAYYCYFGTEKSTAKEGRFLRLYDYMKEKWWEYTKKMWERRKKLTVKFTGYQSVSQLLQLGALAAVLMVISKRVMTGHATLGTFMLAYGTSRSLQGAVGNCFTSIAYFLADAKYVDDFFELESLEMENADESAEPFENADIEFNNIDFTYPGNEKPTIVGLTLKIRQGEKIVIVGENGSGKTTLINLLLGLYHANSGSICINGIELGSCLEQFRKTTSCILQQFGRYNVSLKENIALGDMDRKIPIEEIEDVCKRLGVHDFIVSKPDGYDTIMGTLSKEGEGLSGGQWQRLAITRALIRKKARVMIMDEPTAALDPVAEADIYSRFAEITGDRTTILISHRLGITRLADRILVMDDGRIIEEGTHEVLMRRNGKYAEMYRAQAQWYA